MERSIQRLNNNLASINPDYNAASTESMTTHNIEGFHAISHMRHGLPTTFQHSKDFGRIFQEFIKRSTRWSANYYTLPSSYYPVTKNKIKLEKMPVLQKPPKKPISKRNLAELRMWAKRHGKAVPQRSVRQDNCKFKSGTLLWACM